MNRQVRFLLTATPVIWLIIVAPLVALLSWWLWPTTTRALAWSVLAAPLVTVWIFLSFQTANLVIKWPATQLIGLCTVLLNVTVACTPLLILFNRQTVAIIATVLWLLVTCYAIYKAHSIKDTRLKLESTKLKRAYRIVHLSDIHAGSRSRAFVEKVVEQATVHQADFVLITGDLLDSSAVDTNYLEPLSKFTCPVLLCLGNHERYVNLQKAIEAINAHSIQILRSEAITIDDMQFIGIDDAEHSTQVADELPKISRDPEKFQVLMYHRPDGFDVATSAGIELMLCGHTHAGQMWPFGLLVKRQFPFINGKYTNGRSTLYVSQGTGTWGPIMRLGTSSEMTIIECEPHA